MNDEQRITRARVLAGGADVAHGDVFVPGTPRPQGSMKAYIVKGHANVTSDNKQLGPWRADIAAHIRSHVGPMIAVPTGPVCVAVEFVMPRRAAEPKRVTPAHTRKPDLDKMLRACLDACTGLLFTDDSQVDVLGGMKRTAEPGEQPGAWIRWSSGHDAPTRPVKGSPALRDVSDAESGHPARNGAQNATQP